MKIKFPDDCNASSENDENPEQLKLKLPLPRISEAVKIEELNNLENSMDEKSDLKSPNDSVDKFGASGN